MVLDTNLEQYHATITNIMIVERTLHKYVTQVITMSVNVVLEVGTAH